MAAQPSPHKKKSPDHQQSSPLEIPLVDALVCQQKFLKILDGLKAIVYVSDMQTYEILYINKYTRDIFGDIEGKICWKTIQQGQETPCEFCTNSLLVDNKGKPTDVYNWEFCNTRNNRWYDMYDRAIEWTDSRIVRLEIAYDVTDRKHSEHALARRTRALEVLRRCNSSLIRCQSEEDLLCDICQIIVETGKYRMAWVGYAQDDPEKSVQPVAQYGDTGGYLKSITVSWAETNQGKGPTGTAIRTGKSVPINISHCDPRFAPWHEKASKHGFKSSMALPLLIDKKPIGAISIYAEESDAFDPEEISLLIELAGNLAYGIAAIRNKSEHTQAQKELRLAHEQLALILESLPIIPFTRKAKGDFAITYMSQAVEEITGFTRQQFISDPNFWFSHIHPDDRKHATEELQQLKILGSQKCEYRFQVADGSYRWFSSSRRIIKTTNNQNSYVVGAWQDINKEKKTQHESEQRLQQVIRADKLASLGQVVAGVAHEINNPNSFITYNVPLLEESWEAFVPIITEFSQNNPGKKAGNITFAEMAEEMGEIIGAIKTGSDRINAIVTKLKDFARLDEAAPSKLVNINTVINDSFTIVGAQARKLVGRITVDLAEEIPPFYGHFQKLEQVVANLIMNAAQAVPSKEEGTLSIRTRYVKRLHAVLIEVQDNGRGITPEDMAHIFDPFFTTNRTLGGTGLGLSVSYSLIQEHNGLIGVLSRPGLGTKFTVFLPVDRRQSPLELHPTILCVDDSPLVLGLLKSFFVEAQKMPVELMKSGHDIIHFLKEHPEIDMVLSDINMPGIDGWQLLEDIKGEFPLLPVLLISGDPVNQQQLQKRSCPPDHFMLKPLDLPKLITVINTIGRLRI